MAITALQIAKIMKTVLMTGRSAVMIIYSSFPQRQSYIPDKLHASLASFQCTTHGNSVHKSKIISFESWISISSIDKFVWGFTRACSWIGELRANFFRSAHGYFLVSQTYEWGSPLFYSNLSYVFLATQTILVKPLFFSPDLGLL